MVEAVGVVVAVQGAGRLLGPIQKHLARLLKFFCPPQSLGSLPYGRDQTSWLQLLTAFPAVSCQQPELCGEDHGRESEGGVQVEEEYTEVQPGEFFLVLGSLLKEEPYLRSHS